MGDITYNNLGHFGRLGNQMFQIGATIGIALSNGKTYSFPKWRCNYTNKYYEKYFKETLPLNTIPSRLQVQEGNFSYTNVSLPPNGNFNLNGYYQSEKYFIEHRDEVIKYYTLNDEYTKPILDKYDFTNSCSIHIRRGDYKNLQQFHTLLDVNYYQGAINNIYGSEFSNVKFYIFSDDISWCKENIILPNVIYVEGNEDVIDMYMMSKCENNIIANSSFSWWGAWLNTNKNKRVVAPKNWFGPNNQHLSTNDLCCDGWIEI